MKKTGKKISLGSVHVQWYFLALHIHLQCEKPVN